MTALRVVKNERLEQRMIALDRANQIRAGNAETRARLKKMDGALGAYLVAELLEDMTSTIQALPVSRLLNSIRGVGPGKMEWFCRRAGCSLDRKVRDLTDRQRELLAEKLVHYAQYRERRGGLSRG